MAGEPAEQRERGEELNVPLGSADQAERGEAVAYAIFSTSGAPIAPRAAAVDDLRVSLSKEMEVRQKRAAFAVGDLQRMV